MKAIKVDPETRDIVMAGGRMQFVYDIDVVLQNCDHAIRQQLGELRYAQSKGVDYFGNLFTGNPNYQLFKFQSISALENVDGVVRVSNFDYTVTEGEVSYTADIQTIYGTGNINGNV